MKKFFLLLTVFVFLGCAFDKDSSTTNQTEERENAKLAQAYSIVTGSYRGQLITSGAAQDVELNVFTLQRATGANGARKITLVSGFQKLTPAGRSFAFDGRFTPETGAVVFSSSESALGPDDVHTLDLQLSEDKLTGQAKSYSGIIGNLNLSRTSRQAAIPNEGSEEQYKEAIRRQLAAVAGTYKGNVVPLPGGEKPFPVVVRLSIVEVANQNGLIYPQLMGLLHYPAYKTSDLDLTLSAIYKADVNPATLNITGKPRFPGGTNYIATLNGTLKDGKYTGSFTSTAKGFEGNFTLTKQP